MMRLFLLTILLACQLSAQITLDHTSAGVAKSGTGANSSQTWAHTIGVGANRALFVIVVGLGSGDPSSVTFDSYPLTLVQASASWTCTVWKLVNPPVGAFNIVVTAPLPVINMPSSFDAMMFSAISVFGANQDAPSVLNSVDLSVTAAATSTSITTTVANDWLIGVTIQNNGTQAIANGQTALFTSAVNGAVTASAGYLTNQTLGAHTFGWTNTSGTAHSIAVVAVKPFVGNVIHSGVGGVSAFRYPALAPRPYETSFLHIAANSGGDTQFCTWTSAATRPGNWSGGSIVCSYNDGIGLGCSGSGSNICMYELLTYNSVTPSATTGFVSGLTSYGTNSATACYDTVNQMKSRKTFAFNGLLFQPIFCMGGPGDAFRGYSSGFIISINGGATWCNLKTFIAQGNNCTTGKADGDNPVDTAGFQWPLADGTNKMTRMQIVDFLCQDNSINCPVAGGVDPAYLYFMMVSTDSLQLSVARVLKALGKLIMLPANWQVYNAGSWDSTAQNATNVKATGQGSLCCSTWSYLKDSGTFGAWEHGVGGIISTHPMFTAPYPWGPWTQAPDVPSGQTNAMQFPGPLAGLCPKYAGGRVGCTTWGNSSNGSDLIITEEDLGPIGPVWH